MLFGTGKSYENVNEMIGDYVAIGMTDLTIFNSTEEAKIVKGVHAGYTNDEIQIPIIIVEGENR